MKQYFTTKRDCNGNRYTLIIDHAARTYKKDYNTAHNYGEYITITKTDRRKLAEQAESAGYAAI